MNPLSEDANKNGERPITFVNYLIIGPNGAIRPVLEPEELIENAQVQGKTLLSDGTNRVG